MPPHGERSVSLALCRAGGEQGFDRSGYAHGVVRTRLRRLGSILGTCGGGGHCSGRHWTPLEGPGGKEAFGARPGRIGRIVRVYWQVTKLWVPGDG